MTVCKTADTNLKVETMSEETTVHFEEHNGRLITWYEYEDMKRDRRVNVTVTHPNGRSVERSRGLLPHELNDALDEARRLTIQWNPRPTQRDAQREIITDWLAAQRRDESQERVDQIHGMVVSNAWDLYHDLNGRTTATALGPLLTFQQSMSEYEEELEEIEKAKQLEDPWELLKELPVESLPKPLARKILNNLMLHQEMEKS